tara:strand:- start:316 stop:513 length:198 start_codon:yes stop_codon:yes gene_type:complete
MQKQVSNIVLKSVGSDEIRNMDFETFKILQQQRTLGDTKFTTKQSIAYNSMIDKFYPKMIEMRNK